VTDDGTIALLDWETLAYYPAIFEIEALRWVEHLADATEAAALRQLQQQLRERLQLSEANTEVHFRDLGRIQANSIRCCFSHQE